MITFLSSIVLLILGYIFYGKITEKVFLADPDRTTPATRMADGVDYIHMPVWKCFIVQFLNIAGVGPIFGAIVGAMYGPASFLWIVFGSIFAGAVHDYMSGMMSVRKDGNNMPLLIQSQLGRVIGFFINIFIILMVVLVVVTFTQSPATLLTNMTNNTVSEHVWIAIILVYYFIASFVPIDKIIGKIYPVFGAILLLTAIALIVVMVVRLMPIPEITEGLHNRQSNPAETPIFPMMFVSIACGAISGFHASQSPIISRCIENEKYGRPVFYGAMITEGLVALIWAAAAATFFGGYDGLIGFLAEHNNSAAAVVSTVCNTALGKIGGIMGVLGVVCACITTGDTSVRAGRLIISEFLNIPQNNIWRRMTIVIPIILIALWMMNFQFDVLWRYFGWNNQLLSVFTLWAITVYLCKRKRQYVISLVPALFMTFICTSFICFAKIGFNMNLTWSYISAGCVDLMMLIVFLRWKTNIFKNDGEESHIG